MKIDTLRHSEILFCEMLSENNYIVAYHSNTKTESDHWYWNQPKNSAVQLAAAITASARIYMYPYISREDCYYTDTDSVVLGQPLPKEVISSSVLGARGQSHERILFSTISTSQKIAPIFSSSRDPLKTWSNQNGLNHS
jgi:hypothetical protein